MKFITVSELRLKATEIVRKIENIREEVIVTKNGKPVVLMKFITDEVFSLKEDENERGEMRTKEKMERRKGSIAKGIYKRGNVFWIRYAGLTGRIVFESSHSENKSEIKTI